MIPNHKWVKPEVAKVRPDEFRLCWCAVNGKVYRGQYIERTNSFYLFRYKASMLLVEHCDIDAITERKESEKEKPELR